MPKKVYHPVLVKAHEHLRYIAQRHPEEQDCIAIILDAVTHLDVVNRDLRKKVGERVGLDLFDGDTAA